MIKKEEKKINYKNIFLEVKMLAQDFYMLMIKINFMQVHMNGDHFIFI
jgi:hypothetical protein